MAVKRLTLINKKWYYKGEGNANVVLSVPEDGTVVRVMKNDGIGGDGNGNRTATEMLSMRAKYCEAVRRLLFGDEFVDVPVTMIVSAEELREIDEAVRARRPANRRHKRLEWAGGVVAVCPDYTVLPPSSYWPVSGPTTVYCAEIKPKQGWVLEADRAVTGGDKCVFCANQYLKLSAGIVRSASLYCPLDLFSGQIDRAERAIRGLLRTPQNNLKMFRDGVPIPPPSDEHGYESTAREAFGSADRFCSFVASALLGGFTAERSEPEDVVPIRVQEVEREMKQEQGEQQEEDTPPLRFPGPPCRFDGGSDDALSGRCVLRKILAMQKLQTSGFAAVCRAYDRLGRPSTEYGHVDRLYKSAVGNALETVVFSPLDGYLAATTARDCSVFVTYCETDAHDGVPFDGHRYRVRVKVSDLDPKPMSCVDKHRKRNADVLRACRQVLSHADPL